MIIKREKEKLAQEFHGHIYSLDKEQSFLFAVFFSGWGGGGSSEVLALASA